MLPTQVAFLMGLRDGDFSQLSTPDTLGVLGALRGCLTPGQVRESHLYSFHETLQTISACSLSLTLLGFTVQDHCLLSSGCAFYNGYFVFWFR